MEISVYDKDRIHAFLDGDEIGITMEIVEIDGVSISVCKTENKFFVTDYHANYQSVLDIMWYDYCSDELKGISYNDNSKPFTLKMSSLDDDTVIDFMED